MKRLILLAISLLSLGSAFAQDAASCSDEDFREWARAVVSQGNKQYDRSYRAGIKLYADSLEAMLEQRDEAGKLMQGDSLEFTADLLKLRADWHYENGNYDAQSYRKAENSFREALDMYETFEGMANELNGLPMLRREMAQLMYKLNRYNEALEFTDSAYVAYVNAYDNGLFEEEDSEYVTMMDLMTQKAMCLARTGKTAEALSLIDEQLAKYPKASDGYYEVLRKKGKILMLSQKSGCEKEALALYKQYLTWRKADAFKTLGTMTSEEREDYWMRTRPFVADCYQLEGADPAFLYDVTLFAKGLLLQLNRMSGQGKASESALASLNYTWQQIQEKLQSDACAIEFIQYEKLGKQMMGAIVLKKTGTPAWVQMMAPDDFMKYESGAWTNQERLYTTDGSRKDNMYQDPVLQSTLWSKELLNAMGASKKVYFAPDGYLHQIAIEYMLPEGKRNIDAYRLTSTRRLMESGKVRTDAALIVGGVEYAAKGVKAQDGNDDKAYSYMQNIRANFEYLPGSLTESDAIYTLRSNPKDSLLVGPRATELALRTLSRQFPLINISTHGYFGSAKVPQSTDVKTSMSDESLSQCVLAMAGANPNIAASNFDRSQMDGVLSAREIAECDLSNADLVVLSACQTGLGYITADGVFGIQRGLKNAGAKSLLVSLWNVDDNATCLLMSNFHQNLRSGMTVHKAFMAARESLLNKTSKGKQTKKFNAGTLAEEEADDDEGFSTPQFRNAFILIDALE